MVEEAGEVVFWFDVIGDANILEEKGFQHLIEEGNEILAVVAKSGKTAGQNLE